MNLLSDVIAWSNVIKNHLFKIKYTILRVCKKQTI